VGGGASSTEVVELYCKTSDQMADGGFKLRKWLTNDAQVRAKIETDAKVDSGQAKVTKGRFRWYDFAYDYCMRHAYAMTNDPYCIV